MVFDRYHNFSLLLPHAYLYNRIVMTEFNRIGKQIPDNTFDHFDIYRNFKFIGSLHFYFYILNRSNRRNDVHYTMG